MGMESSPWGEREDDTYRGYGVKGIKADRKMTVLLEG